jgi:hypothetical protein
MSRTLKVILWLLITSGFVFGFAGMVFSDQSPLVDTPNPDTYQFQRLHIFLFNLVSGGSVLLYFTEGNRKLSWKGSVFLLGSIAYALAAFFNQYLLASMMAIGLAGIVELIRVHRFSIFPLDFFKTAIPVARKFHQAALLCLSLGLLISAFVMLNNDYLHIFNQPEMILNDFFLGFSFPISLLTFSVIFSLAKEDEEKHIRFLKEISFWIINLGVIIFFIFIIFQVSTMQIVVATLLFSDVLLIFFLFKHDSKKYEEEKYLVSGILFLVVTSVTGILITLGETFLPVQEPHSWALLLQIHAYISLYGWNLTGLMVVIRYREFPLQLHYWRFILFHWLVVSLLAPLGNIYPLFTIVALPAFTWLMGLILFSPGHRISPNQTSEIIVGSSMPKS